MEDANQKLKIATIVVTYNRVDLLLECIDSILKQSLESDIIIIDNNSTDNTREQLADLIDSKKVRYYNTGRNIGGAGGFQYGLKKAYGLGYDLMWIMDDDSMPQSNSLSELIKAHNKLNGNYGYLSSKVEWTDGTLCKMNIQRSSLRHDITDFENDLIKCSMATFVSILIKKEAIEKVGLPIKEFFIWADDAEYTRRISKGFACYVVPKSIVIHKTKLNFGSQIWEDSFERIDRYRYLYRNGTYFYRKEGIKGWAIKIAQVFIHCVKVIVKAPDHKVERIKMIVKGTIEGLKFNPQIEYV